MRQVPPGTNGGVSLTGTLAGFGGASVIAITSLVLLPFCDVDTSIRGRAVGNTPGFEGGNGWGWQEKSFWVLAVTIWGGLGSVLDSALGGWFQASVIDKRTGKVIEGTGGKKVSAIPQYRTGLLKVPRFLYLDHGFLQTRRVTSRVATLRAA